MVHSQIAEKCKPTFVKLEHTQQLQRPPDRLCSCETQRQVEGPEETSWRSCWEHLCVHRLREHIEMLVIQKRDCKETESFLYEGVHEQ